MKKILICALMCCSFSVIAKPQHVTVKLTSIQAVKTSEKSGDELYFSITEYSNQSKPQILRVPVFPMHWLSQELPKVKNVILWQGDVNDDEAVLLILSLLEQDLPPWDLDDHIGSAKVQLHNNKGKMEITWGQPDFVDQPKVEQANPKAGKYEMHGDGSDYNLEFNAIVE